MKTISLNVSEPAYELFKELAAKRGLSVAELIRRAMDDFLDKERNPRCSIRDLTAHRSGGMKQPWTRAEVFDEMVGGGDDLPG